MRLFGIHRVFGKLSRSHNLPKLPLGLDGVSGRKPVPFDHPRGGAGGSQGWALGEKRVLTSAGVHAALDKVFLALLEAKHDN